MPRQSLDACMFCGDNPCTCEGVKKKASPRKGRKAEGEGVPASPPSPPVNTVDLKAAMKAALNVPKPVVDSHHQPENLSVRDQKEKSPIDEELAQALNNLVPILHPTELRTHAEILNRPDLRAIRWKRRNG